MIIAHLAYLDDVQRGARLAINITSLHDCAIAHRVHTLVEDVKKGGQC